MHATQTSVVLALVAAAAAAPLQPQALEARAAAAAAGGGLSKILGNVASGAGILSSGLNIGNFLGDLIGGDEAAKREISALVTRELNARAVAPAAAAAAGGGLSKILGNVASGAGILSSGINIGGFLGDLFGGGDEAAKREISDLVTREINARAAAPAAAAAAGGGLSKILGNVASGAGILSGGINIGGFLGDLFGGDDAAAKRELGSLIHAQLAARELPTELTARQAAAAAGGLSKILGNVASGAGILSSGINIGGFLGDLFGGGDAAAKRDISAAVHAHLAARELPTEISARQAAAAAGGLSKILGNVASGAGILSSGINIGGFLGDLFGGDDAAAKRAFSPSQLLGGAATGLGVLSGGVSAIDFLKEKGILRREQELINLLSRAVDLE